MKRYQRDMPVYFPACAKSFMSRSYSKEIRPGIFIAHIPNDFGDECIVVDVSKVNKQSKDWLSNRGINVIETESSVEIKPSLIDPEEFAGTL